MTPTPEVGGALRNARQARHLSLSDVAVKAGMSVATLSRIETGKQNVDVTLLVTLAGILHITPSTLLDGNGDGRQPAAVLADELAMLSPSERARVLATALKQSRKNGSREALHARVEGLLTSLDLIREELLLVRRDMRRGR
ncbi:MAG TPA: helix-turn-helix transcriptional regulator [Thermoanaerobaculia bacterium]|nr:helix-turn-helix transcriptional regulator [Thermoanaerobaculia bacterium]